MARFAGYLDESSRDLSDMALKGGVSASATKMKVLGAPDVLVQLSPDIDSLLACMRDDVRTALDMAFEKVFEAGYLAADKHLFNGKPFVLDYLDDIKLFKR